MGSRRRLCTLSNVIGGNDKEFAKKAAWAGIRTPSEGLKRTLVAQPAMREMSWSAWRRTRSGRALDHLEESVAVHASEKSGGGDGEDGFGDPGFDHEPRNDLNLGEGDGRELLVAADEAFEAGFVEVVGPVGGVVGAAEDGELEGAVGEVDDALLEAGGVVVDDGDDFALVEEDVSGMPVAVDDLGGPVVEAGGIHFFVGGGVGFAEGAEGGAEFV